MKFITLAKLRSLEADEVARGPFRLRSPFLPERPEHALRRVADAFQVKPKAGDPRIVQQVGGDIGQPDHGLIARRHHIGNRQPAGLHGDIDGNVRGLHQNGRAGLAGRKAVTALLVRPQQRPIGIVDQPIAVGAKDGHVASRLKEPLFEG